MIDKNIKNQITSAKIKGLYAIIDNTFSPNKTHVQLATEFLVGGCRLMQLRMKKSSCGVWDQEVFDTAKEIMTLKKKFDFTFIINDYVDVAAELTADGIHVGANDMEIADIRKRAGANIIIGYSSHSIEEALAARNNGADYVALGAIYPTKTKGPSHPIQGIQRLKELVAKMDAPIVAIGGINRKNIDEVIATGVASVAMITGLTEASSISKETEWYVNKFSTLKGTT